MEKKYFNMQRFEALVEQSKKDPYDVIPGFKDYLDDYPEDYHGRSFYILALLRICKYKEAAIEYNKIVDALKDKTNENIRLTKSRPKFRENMRIARVKIFVAMRKYNELEEYFFKNYSLFDMDAQSLIHYFLKLQKGEEIDTADSTSYRLHQMADYKEDAFLNHASRHLSSTHIKIGNAGRVMFWEDFPLEEIFEEIKKHIPSSRKQFLGLVDDAYYFKYDNCGYADNMPTDYFKVVLLHDTDLFITMYPEQDCGSYKVVDLNHIPRKTCGIDKGVSQVDKFYRRLAKKGQK